MPPPRQPSSTNNNETLRLGAEIRKELMELGERDDQNRYGHGDRRNFERDADENL